MNKRILQGFFAGVIGAIILAAMMYSLQAANLSGAPGFVGIYRAVLGATSPQFEHIFGAIGFVLAGGLWGCLLAAIVRQPTTLRGMMFGFAPTLFLLLVIAKIVGQPIFGGFTVRGILLPIIFNVVIWGGVVGWLTGKLR